MTAPPGRVRGDEVSPVRRPTRAEVCCVAMAECFRGDGEILANPIGTIPMIGGRLARATFEPDLMMTDGEAALVANDEAFEWPSGRVVEAYNPYRSMFDIVWSGRRHVVMGASQIDAHGNQNFAAVGSDWSRPTVQLLGFRGAPGNTIENATSYFVPNHSRRVFVERVDVVTGVGTSRAAALAPESRRSFSLRFVVTNLCVMDLGGDGGRLRVVTVHPGVTLDDVRAATGFELAVADELTETRPPSEHDLHLLRDVIDPRSLREQEIPAPTG